MKKKSVISLIAYDANMLIDSIKSYYHYVDEIVLGLDEDRVSWSGNKFTFDEEELWASLEKIDTKNKINVVEHNFHESKIAIENDNYERNYLKAQCTYDWIFSFDADEVLVNPKEFFIDFLPIVERYSKNADLLFTWYLPYKQFIHEKTNSETGEVTVLHDVLVIANEDGSFFNKDIQGFVTDKGNTYTYCRWTENQKKIMTPLAIIHWSFCRKDEDLELKSRNFGHSDKTDDDPFYHNHKLVTLDNYAQLRNFKTSGFGQHQWPRLVKLSNSQLLRVAKEQATNII